MSNERGARMPMTVWVTWYVCVIVERGLKNRRDERDGQAPRQRAAAPPPAIHSHVHRMSPGRIERVDVDETRSWGRDPAPKRSQIK